MSVEAVLLVLVVLAGGVVGEWSGEQTEALLEWIGELGGGVDGISFKSVPGMGMGAVTTRDLEPGTVITRTPLTAIISLEHALVTELFGSLSDQLPQLSNTNLKSLFLAYERKKSQRREDRERENKMREKDGEEEGEQMDVVEEAVEGKENEEDLKSFWQPYLDTLPRVLHTTLFFSAQELEDLQISMVKEFAIKQQSAAKKAYELVAEVADNSLPELRDLSLEDLKWGVSIWSSRAHSVRVRDSLGEWQIVSCLVPLSDMFNMAAREEDVNVRCDTNEDSTHFECHTTTTIPRGKQVLVEYAVQADRRHNGRLLLHYGFVIPGNPYDSVSIKLPELGHDLPHYRDRLELAKKLPVLKKPFLQLTHPAAPSATIEQLLRAVRLSQGSVPELQTASQLSPPFSLPLSPSSEKRVVKTSMAYIRNILSSYPTSLEQDIHILQTERLSPNSRLALQLRSEEKRLLTANMAHLLSLMTHDSSHHHHTHHHKTEL